MDLLVIRGGQPLAGRTAVAGSKNATLPIMAASLMIDGPVTLAGVPDLADVTTLSQVLASLGVVVRRAPGVSPGVTSFTRALAEPSDTAGHPLAPHPSSQGEGEGGATQITLHVRDDSNCVAAYEHVRRMRASVCVLGPLVAKRGRAVVSLPGGCNIGDRPIDLHLRGLAALGADVRFERGYIVASAKRLRGAEIDLAGPRGSTVTGTANVLAAATLASGPTVLRNAAREPEIDDFARFLVAAGATIDGIGSHTLEVSGVEVLQCVAHHVIPDRIEAATLMMAAAIMRGDITLDGVNTEHHAAVLAALDAAGITIDDVTAKQPGCLEQPGCCRSIRIRAAEPLRSVDVAAEPYPGFPTDLQAQWTALMTQAAGTSRVRDDVFPDRFLHVPELARLGAAIGRCGSTAIIHGGRRLRGANVMASDLRASAALVLAALAAEGETVIRRIYHLDRGYERLDAKLAALGANVIRADDEAAIAVPPPLPAA